MAEGIQDIRVDITSDSAEAIKALKRVSEGLEELDKTARTAVRGTSRLDSAMRRAARAMAVFQGRSRQVTAAKRAEARARQQLEAAIRAGDRAASSAARSAIALAQAEGRTAKAKQVLAREALDAAQGQARLAQKFEDTARAARRAATAAKSVGTANDNVALSAGRAASAMGRSNAALRRSSGAMRASIQNAAFQVGDLATQLELGVNPARAFAQQGSQLLGAFGPMGAVLGGVVAVAVPLAATLFDLGDGARDAAEAGGELTDTLDRLRVLQDRNRDAEQLDRTFGAWADRIREVDRLERDLLASRGVRQARASVSELLDLDSVHPILSVFDRAARLNSRQVAEQYVLAFQEGLSDAWSESQIRDFLDDVYDIGTRQLNRQVLRDVGFEEFVAELNDARVSLEQMYEAYEDIYRSETRTSGQTESRLEQVRAEIAAMPEDAGLTETQLRTLGEALQSLREAQTGVDIHQSAVELARVLGDIRAGLSNEELKAQFDDVLQSVIDLVGETAQFQTLLAEIPGTAEGISDAFGLAAEEAQALREAYERFLNADDETARILALDALINQMERVGATAVTQSEEQRRAHEDALALLRQQRAALARHAPLVEALVLEYGLTVTAAEELAEALYAANGVAPIEDAQQWRDALVAARDNAENLDEAQRAAFDNMIADLDTAIAEMLVLAAAGGLVGEALEQAQIQMRALRDAILSRLDNGDGENDCENTESVVNNASRRADARERETERLIATLTDRRRALEETHRAETRALQRATEEQLRILGGRASAFQRLHRRQQEELFRLNRAAAQEQIDSWRGVFSELENLGVRGLDKLGTAMEKWADAQKGTFDSLVESVGASLDALFSLFGRTGSKIGGTIRSISNIFGHLHRLGGAQQAAGGPAAAGGPGGGFGLGNIASLFTGSGVFGSTGIFSATGALSGVGTAFTALTGGIFKATGAIGSLFASGGALAGLGSALAALGPIAAIAAGVGVLFKKAFGRKYSHSGISGVIGATGFQGRAYDHHKGGWFRSNRTYFRNLDPSIADTLDQVVHGVQGALGESAKALGLALGDALKTTSRAFNIVTNGKSQEQITEELTQQITEYGNTVAAAILNTKAYQRGAETSLETLTRLAQSLTGVNEHFRILGRSIRYAGLRGAAAAQTLVDAFGGLGALQQSTATYLDRFYSDAERTALLTRQIRQVFQGLGQNLPNTRAAFRGLVESQNLSTESGRRTYASLLNLAGVMDTLYQANERAAEAAKREADAKRKAAEEARKLAAEQLRGIQIVKEAASNSPAAQHIGLGWGGESFGLLSRIRSAVGPQSAIAKRAMQLFQAQTVFEGRAAHVSNTAREHARNAQFAQYLQTRSRAFELETKSQQAEERLRKIAEDLGIIIKDAGRDFASSVEGAEPAGPLHVNLTGLAPDRSYTGQQLRDLLNRLQDEATDRGIVIRVAS